MLVELAGLVGPAGEGIGIDASEQMLAAATDRAAAAGVPARFRRGDAMALDFADGGFDVVRSERTLQWVSDPALAIAEMVRVTQPGGAVSIIDTDWRTLLVDHPRPDLTQPFFDALTVVRGEQMSVGGRLVNLARDAGLVAVEATAETHMWLEWDPDQFPTLPGFFPLRLVAADLADRGLLDEAGAAQMIDEFENTARRDRFFVSLTMFAVVARVPES